MVKIFSYLIIIIFLFACNRTIPIEASKILIYKADALGIPDLDAFDITIKKATYNIQKDNYNIRAYIQKPYITKSRELPYYIQKVKNNSLLFTSTINKNGRFKINFKQDEKLLITYLDTIEIKIVK